ncbi:hypothetical protein HDU84_005438 [Entophlyctis sp. JEL0112]|nr:hypothetical protein HDU84_005438 [Entophlyctis sp. JEL0112]
MPQTQPTIAYMLFAKEETLGVLPAEMLVNPRISTGARAPGKINTYPDAIPDDSLQLETIADIAINVAKDFFGVLVVISEKFEKFHLSNREHSSHSKKSILIGLDQLLLKLKLGRQESALQ